MNISAALPNLLIGLREGLESGLIVTLLLSTISKISDPLIKKNSRAAVWLGVISALSVSVAFALIITFSSNDVSTVSQEIIAAFLSLLAVVFVTWMIIWMRDNSRYLKNRIESEIGEALKIGVGAIIIIAFFSVAREGLETTLFLWANTKAASESFDPIIGAIVGIVVAVILCILINKRLVKINIGKFFSITSWFLVILAAGVLVYAIGEFQTAGLIPGQQWVAFDLSNHINSSSWWVTMIQGVTQITPRMTVMQVTLWFVYILVMIWVFKYRKANPAPLGMDKNKSKLMLSIENRAAKLSKKPWLVGSTMIVIPLLIAGFIIFILPKPPVKGYNADVSLTNNKECAPSWGKAQIPAGETNITMTNKSNDAAEINLVNSSNQLVAEIETLGPQTSVTMNAVLNAGTYKILCLLPGGAPKSSAEATVIGNSSVKPPRVINQLTIDDLMPATKEYEHYVVGKLDDLKVNIVNIVNDLQSDNIPAAKSDWLKAQINWQLVGAAYDSFGDLGSAVSMLNTGYQEVPKGMKPDKDFVGLHRIEYGLYHGESSEELLPIAQKTLESLKILQANESKETIDPTDMPIRAHEILEDAIRDHLNGLTDYGSAQQYTLTNADLQATRVVLKMLDPLLERQEPGIVNQINTKLNILQEALSKVEVNGVFKSQNEVTRQQAEAINSALGSALETLAAIPTLLEVPLPR